MHAVALALILSSVLSPIYRSVGSAPGALQSGAGNPLSITVISARFTAPLDDDIGVGDVIQYDSNGDLMVDALAFLSARSSATAFEVRSASGGVPVAVASTTTWQIFRAYRTLADAVNTANRAGLSLGGTENPSIDAALRDFDTFSGGKDLPAAAQNWNVACYDDGAPDDTLVIIDAPWVTDRDHGLRIFTPVSPLEAGQSQRHRGTWGTGARRTHALHVVEKDVWLDGLSIRQDRVLNGPGDPNYDNRVFIGHTGSQGSTLLISNCFGQQAEPTTFARTFDFYEDQVRGAQVTTVHVWNSIGINDSASPLSAAFLSNSFAAISWFNCTGIATGGGAAFFSDDEFAGAPAATIVNGLGVSATGPAVFIKGAASKFAISFSAVSDVTLDATTTTTPAASNRVRQGFAFRGAGDYHLALSDSGARGFGTNLTASLFRPFFDDIDGDPRPATGAWDIGADAVIATDAGVPDAGQADAGQADAGSDAGQADAGTDAGQADAGISDAGAEPADGGPSGPSSLVVGCGCSSIEGTTAALWGLALIFGRRREAPAR